jgi:hypothetical protein
MVIADMMPDMKKGGKGEVRSLDRKWRATVGADANFTFVIKLAEKCHKG